MEIIAQEFVKEILKKKLKDIRLRNFQRNCHLNCKESFETSSIELVEDILKETPAKKKNAKASLKNSRRNFL